MNDSKKPSILSGKLHRLLRLLAPCALLFAPCLSQAQWQSATYALKGGWNAIYLHGDATHATPDELFPNTGDTANVIEVWRWNPNPNQVQFTGSALVPSSGTPEWSVWRRGLPAESNLTQMNGQTGYLVRCKGTATATAAIGSGAVTAVTIKDGGNGYSAAPAVTIAAPLGGTAATATAVITGGAVTAINIVSGGTGYTAAPVVTIAAPSTNPSYSIAIVQKPRPPSSTWVRSGANLMGFPTFKNGATFPLFSNYFATFPAAIAANTKIFKYVGGDLGPTNPIQVFSPTLERVDRNQAYWFEADVVSNFIAPVDISLSDVDGLDFGRTGSVVTVRLRNRSATSMTLTLTPVTSIAAPAGQDGITGPVPLTKRTFDSINNVWNETAIGGAYTEIIPAQSTVTLSFGINRVAMTGSSNALYASLLRLRDGGNLFEIDLPASARKTSLAGLWVGEALIDSVSSQVAGSAAARGTVSGGALTAVEVTNRGVGYTSAPTVTIAPPFSFVQALATANVASNGTISSLTVNTAGTAYWTPPAVTVAAPTAGVQAAATSTISSGLVSNITVTNGGAGYFAGATVTVAAPAAGTQVVATAVRFGVGISSITVNNGGTGYLTPPTITVAPPGIGAVATATLTGDSVSLIALNVAGSNYASAPVVMVAPPSTQAAATAVLAEGGVSAITITAPGSGYLGAPTVTIAAPGVQATATASLSGGGVGSASVALGGSGYTSAPQVFVAPPASGIAATAVATISGGVVTSVVITRPGTNYSSAPLITIAAPGTTATAEATMSGGLITGITVTDPGSGYSSAPTITVGPPRLGPPPRRQPRFRAAL